MAIEDEIVNISDLDVGNEILKTDKLIVESGNGTKLLDFKDFIIGLDNISFYHLISGEDNTGNVTQKIVGGFEVLTSPTDDNYRPDYSKLKGSIDLAVKMYDAYTWVASNSAKPDQNIGDIANILSRLGHIQALLEQPTTAGLLAGTKLRLHKTQSYWPIGHKKAGQPAGDDEWYDHGEADLEVVSSDTDLISIPAQLTGSDSSGNIKSVNFKVSISGTAESGVAVGPDNNLWFNNTEITPAIGTLEESPFSMTYPKTEYTTSTISFSVYVELDDSSVGANSTALPLHVYKNDALVRTSYPAKIGTTFIYDFSFVDRVLPGQVITIKYNNAGALLRLNSSFSGVRMF